MIDKKKIGIIGAARSGIAAAKLAKRKGLIPFVSDAKNPELLGNVKEELERNGIEFEFGKHDKIFNSDIIVLSPGVPIDSPVVKKAELLEIEVISEIEFAYGFSKAKIVAITGTNGKTTTTMLISHLLNKAAIGNKTAGNIGVAFSDVVDFIDEDDFAVLELSSFQLDKIKHFRPDYAILLNITPDHLNRYENKFENYIKSKFGIVKNQDFNDVFIINADDETIMRNLPATTSKVFGFSLNERLINGAFVSENKIYFSTSGNAEFICSVSDLSLKGEHNLMNFLSVTVFAKLLNLENKIIEEAFSTFPNVEHRLEFVREKNGVVFINDSKATNTVSTYFALRSFKSPIRLILGGRDKGNDYNEILKEVKERVIKIYTTGESSNKIYDFFSKHIETAIFDDFKKMILSAFNDADNGDIILFSPACASFDLFSNYEERGEEFKKIVNGL